MKHRLIASALALSVIVTATQTHAQSAAAPPIVRTATGLSYQVLTTGNGEQAKSGQSVTIHEITKLSNGTVIFDSYAKNTPITFLLGGKQVIDGVDQGVTGMRVGEKRRLIIPPTLSVRSGYPANTPKDSTLYIDLELVGIKK